MIAGFFLLFITVAANGDITSNSITQMPDQATCAAMGRRATLAVAPQKSSFYCFPNSPAAQQ